MVPIMENHEVYDSIRFNGSLDSPGAGDLIPAHHDGDMNGHFQGDETPQQLRPFSDFNTDAGYDFQGHETPIKENHEVYNSIRFEGGLDSPVVGAGDLIPAHHDGDMNGHFQGDETPQQLRPFSGFNTDAGCDFQGYETPQQLPKLKGGPDASYRQQYIQRSEVNEDSDRMDTTQDSSYKSQAFERFQCNDGTPAASPNMNTNDTPNTRGIQPQCQYFDEGTSSSEWQYIADLLSNEPGSSISLEQWVEIEKRRSSSPDQKESTLRKLSVAYGICKLLESPGIGTDHCTMNNFVVRELNDEFNTNSISGGHSVDYIGMVEPSLSVHLPTMMLSPNGFGACNSTKKDTNCRDIQATVMDNVECSTDKQKRDTARDERGLCNALGKLMYAFFSKEQNFADDKPAIRSSANDTIFVQPTKKRVSLSQASISVPNSIDAANESNGEDESLFFVPSLLDEFDCFPSVSQLIGDLLSCGDGLFCSDSAFNCIKDVADELHLILKEPHRFLFERVFATHLGKHLLTFPNEKLFGRSFEIADIANSYQRVASTGRTECVIVGGVSGCGKTALVRKAIDSAKLPTGYVIERKFEEVSTQSPLNVVLSAIDELCLQIASIKSLQHHGNLYLDLVNEFGTNNLNSLSSLVPSVTRLIPSHPANQTALNCQALNTSYSRICHNLKSFVRILSRYACPCVIFLDDLQWADSTSLSVVHTILSGVDGPGSILFVGSYRINENRQHVSYFIELLSKMNVRFTAVVVPCLHEQNVNLMVSDIIGVVPRLGESLSSMVYRKTKGNPFFIQQFLRTLVDKDLLIYNLREKRWTWDVDKIGAEPITQNVLQLITLKMHSLSGDIQTALKIASCFGIKVPAFIVDALSGTQQYTNLQQTIKCAVQEGYIDFDGTYYRFAHDKVKQSAYELIESSAKDRFHFEVGMALYSCFVSQDDDKLFTVIEQINYGVPSLLSSPSQQISIAKLNYRAGQLAAKRWNYVDALVYMKAAHSLLPTDSWETEYELTLNVCFQLAKAAYPSGEIDLARDLLKKIHERGRSLEDKLDASHLLITILHHEEQDSQEALDMCCNTLTALGEKVVSPSKLSTLTQLTFLFVEGVGMHVTPNHEILSWETLPQTEHKRKEEIMRFYWQLSFMSYTKGDSATRSIACGYYVSRWARFSMENKVFCRYTPRCLAFYGALWIYGFITMQCREAYRLGKIALQYLNKNEHQTDLTATYLVYYGFIAYLFEPIQACAEQHRRAYNVGMQIGETHDAISNLFFLIPRMIECGTNLLAIKNEIERYQELAKSYSHPVLGTYMQWYMDTIYLLVENDSSSVIVSPASSKECNITDATAVHIVQLIMPALYLGHFERAIFLAKKFEALEEHVKARVPMRVILLSFYHGLALVGAYRRKQSKKLMRNLEKTIAIVRKASELSSWNFKNKLLLLEAEKLSILGDDSENPNYDAAITMSQSSKFIHEEALTCELAGNHFERKNKNKEAVSFYEKAEKCYREWGAEKKVNQMTEIIQRIS